MVSTFGLLLVLTQLGRCREAYTWRLERLCTISMLGTYLLIAISKQVGHC